MPPDMTSDWHRRSQLPQLLAWPTRGMVKLARCRVHNGEFQTLRFTDDGAHVNPTGGEPQLEFIGRDGDSLRFQITNAAPLPLGYTDPSPWGFRYDIAPDYAVVLPEVIATPLAPGPCQMFEVAWCWARQAQRAIQLERELTMETYLPRNVWDGLHEGQLTGERLSTSFRTMEKA